MKLQIAITLVLVLSVSACERSETDAQKAVETAAITAAAQEQITVVEEAVSTVVEQVAEEKVAVEKPVDEAKAQVAQVVASVEASKPMSGEVIYKKSCVACHASGAANAPKLGDKTAWAPRIAKGEKSLLQSAINGMAGTAMMKRGGCGSCSDDDLKATVAYMIGQSK